MKKFVTENDENSTKLFAKYLKDNGLVNDGDVLLEYSTNFFDSISIQKCFDGYDRLIYTESFPIVKSVYNELIVPNGKNISQLNFISNCFNDNAFEFLYSNGKDISFNVGICTNFMREYIPQKLHLIDYEKELIAKGINVHAMEDNLERNNHIFLLTNRGVSNVKK